MKFILTFQNYICNVDGIGKSQIWISFACARQVFGYRVVEFCLSIECATTISQLQVQYMYFKLTAVTQ